MGHEEISLSGVELARSGSVDTHLCVIGKYAKSKWSPQARHDQPQGRLCFTACRLNLSKPWKLYAILHEVVSSVGIMHAK